MQQYSEKIVGLNAEEVSDRKARGLQNRVAEKRGKSAAQIVGQHLLTYFNLLNFALAAVVLLVGSYRNVLFLGVVFSNLAIGIFQELRAKHTVEKLSLLTAPTAKVLRDGTWQEVPTEELVQEDVVVFRAGDQICADGRVLEGNAEVNESLLTGEADTVSKQAGDGLLSGSFVVAGECCARLERVGEASYAARLAKEAKKEKKSKSELMSALNRLIRVISVLILPLGGLLFAKQYVFLDLPMEDSIVSTVAALIGMIPEGLMLLTSVALAVGVIRLGKYRTLVQELYGIETLARVDVLCVDKTGTITQGDVELREVLPLSEEDPHEILRELMGVLLDQNATAQAIRGQFSGAVTWKCEEIYPFSSERKWSGAKFEGKGIYRLGAPEFLLDKNEVQLQEKVQELASQGIRVLVLTQEDETSGHPVALLLFEDKIRETAPETFRFFREQGVTVKVISGDHPAAVSAVARRAGIPAAEKAIDLSTVSEQNVGKYAEECTVFGRVTPEQKRTLVECLKKAGHTVAMIGDGINDVLALRKADCSIAMASGSDATKHVSKLVLLDSDFSALPRVVLEGRRVINNIQRSASLFLVKTGYSFLLTLFLLAFSLSYPFVPIQLTLVSSLTIGIPSFLLALEPNKNRVEGNFLRNVLDKALPGAFTIVACLLTMMDVGKQAGLAQNEINTMCTLLAGFVGLLVLTQVCRPLKSRRGILCIVETGLFYGAAILCKEIFLLADWNWKWGSILLIGMAGAVPVFFLFRWLVRKFHPIARISRLVSERKTKKI